MKKIIALFLSLSLVFAVAVEAHPQHPSVLAPLPWAVCILRLQMRTHR